MMQIRTTKIDFDNFLVMVWGKVFFFLENPVEQGAASIFGARPLCNKDRV